MPARPARLSGREQPNAEVLVDGRWWPAELRMRTARADGYHYNATWHRDDSAFLDTFPAERVRIDQTDHATTFSPRSDRKR